MGPWRVLGLFAVLGVAVDAIGAPPPTPPPASDYAFVFLIMGNAVAADASTAVAAVMATETVADVVAFVWRVDNAAYLRKLHSLCPRVIYLRDRGIVKCPHKVTRQGTLNGFQQYACAKIPLLLALTDYQRVIFVDADLLFLANFDHLFLSPIPRGGITGSGNPQNARELGSDGTAKHALNGALTLLEPSLAHRDAFLKFMVTKRGGTSERGDQYLTKDYYDGKTHFLPVSYNWGLWNAVYLQPVERGLLEWSLRNPVFGIHFSGKYKPWLPTSSPEHRLWVAKVSPQNRALAEKYGCVWKSFGDALDAHSLKPSEECSVDLLARTIREEWSSTIQRCFSGPGEGPNVTAYTASYPFSINAPAPPRRAATSTGPPLLEALRALR